MTKQTAIKVLLSNMENGKLQGVAPQDFLDGVVNQEVLLACKVMNFSLAANGTIYRKDFRGFLPTLVDEMYEGRKTDKKLMLEAKARSKEIENTLSLSKESNVLLEEELKQKKTIAHQYDISQLCKKIQLNSLYGALGNIFFRYYNVDMAEAITMSGQLSIRWIQQHLNVFVNKICSTNRVDYVVASDTDSVYFYTSSLVDAACPNKSQTDTAKFLDRSCKEIILPFLGGKCNELSDLMNAYENKIRMKREAIANKGIWTAKKRYMLNVLIGEDGILLTNPELKMMGIETRRSSTPAPIRDALNDSIHIIMNGTEKELQTQVEGFRKKFMSLKPEEIATPSSCNGMKDYRSTSTIYKKGTPVAVKGALLHNHHLKKFGIEKKYEEIKEGEKVKFIYLKTPNPISDGVISFQSSLPKELDLHRFVDYKTQYEKKFLSPLKTILDTVGWSDEEKSTLDSLFA